MSLSLAGYLAVAGEPNVPFVIALTVSAQCFLAVVVAQLPRLLRLPFYPSYAAMTFPFVICATALGKALACLTDAGWAVPHVLFLLAGIEAALATAMVCYVLARYAHHIVHTAHAERRLLTVAQADANTATSPARGFGEHAVH